MAEKRKRTVWFWARLAFLLLVASSVASAGTAEWQMLLPGALFMTGGFLLIFCGVFQWVLLALLKRFLPGDRQSIPYSLSVNPFSGECFFITAFIPYVALSIAAGIAAAAVIDGIWPLFWQVGVLLVIGGFWIRWNRLIARRYCRITSA